MAAAIIRNAIVEYNNDKQCEQLNVLLTRLGMPYSELRILQTCCVGDHWLFGDLPSNQHKDILKNKLIEYYGVKEANRLTLNVNVKSDK